MLQLKDGRRFLHTPDDPADQYYFDWVSDAQKEVLISDYSFNFPKFEITIPALLESGLTVKLVLDHSQGAGNSEKPLIIFLQALLDKYPDTFKMVLGTSPLHKINHDKFTVKDGKEVSYGSWNYTKAASAENNNLIFDPTPLVVSWYTQIWQDEYDWIEANEPQTMYNLGLMGVIENNEETLTMLNKLFGNLDYKDIAVRAAKTFAQAFVGFLLLNVTNITQLTNISTDKQLVVAGVVAAVSVVWNVVLVPIWQPVKLKLGFK